MAVTDGVPEYARGYEDFAGRVATAMSRSRPAWQRSPEAPEGSPNVILMVIDDMGFSDLGPYGSEIPTPVIDEVASRGAVLNSYHTPPVCSPARAALLTGVNPHRAGFGNVASGSPGFPGYAFELGDDVVTLPEALRASGYATFAIGKWHLSRSTANLEGGPRTSWPTQRGFEQYYGCLEGFTPFFAPNRLVRDNTTVDVDRYPDGYYLTDDLTDQAIGMIRGLRTTDARKPFFLYFAHNAMHGPLGAKAEDIERQRGRYAEGWDVIRAQRFARQIASGLFSEGTAMVDRNHEPGADVSPWNDLTAEQRERYQRYMEVYAAMVTNIDENLGRLLDVLDEYDERDNTIVVIVSDNGGTNEGGAEGTRSYFSEFIQALTLPSEWEGDRPLEDDLIGGPRAMVHYPRGWAMASNTPFRLYKGSTFGGGVRSPMVFSWPRVFPPSGDGRIVTPFMYATDVMPTILEACGIAPDIDARIPRATLDRDGVSLWGEISGRGGATPRRVQYTEFIGNYGIYQDGWKLLSRRTGAAFDPDAEQPWQLFDVVDDPAETRDLAREHPQRVEALAELFRREAWRNTVFPIADVPAVMAAQRPQDSRRLSGPLTIRAGSPTVERSRAAMLINRRSAVIDIVLGEALGGGEGVLVAHGDQGGGYALWVEGGELRFTYNEYGIAHRAVVPVTAGLRHVRVRFDLIPDRPYFWRVSLSTDDGALHELDPVMMLTGLCPFTGIDVGIDRRGPVDWDMHVAHGSFAFTGCIDHVTYTPGPAADYDPVAAATAAHVAAAVYD